MYDKFRKMKGPAFGRRLRSLAIGVMIVLSVAPTSTKSQTATTLDSPTAKNTPMGDSCEVTSTKISRDGKYLAFACDERVNVWNIETGQQIISSDAHGDAVSCVAFSPDGKTLATGSFDHTIRFWTLGGQKENTSLIRADAGLKSVAFSSDGNSLAAVTESWPDKFIWLYHLRTGKVAQRLKGHNHIVTSVAFSPDGKMLASGSWDQTVKLWNLETGLLIKSFKGHRSVVSSVTFSPDGTLLASGSWDKTVRLWQIKGDEPVKTFEGHTFWVLAVAFSPDGQSIISGGGDKSVRIWNVKGTQDTKILKGHHKFVRSVSVSPDGTYFVTGGNDGTLMFWKIDSDKPLATLFPSDTGDWALVTPDGSYDTNRSPATFSKLDWIFPAQGSAAYPRVVHDHTRHEPGLFKRVMKRSVEKSIN